MTKRGLFIVLACLTTFCPLKANLSDSLIVLEEVVAKGVKFDGFSIGAKVYSFDSVTIQNYSSNSLADLLLQHSQVSLTMYGPGGLANVSMRGGTSDHTAIIWNGFNLKPPMSGNLNFSAIPVGFINQVYIQPGGSSTLYGSGAATGIIFLCDELKLNTKYIEAFATVEKGSFNSYSGMAKVGFSTGRFASSFKAGYQASENNFPFLNTEKTRTPIDTLKHAGYASKMFSQQNALLIGRKTKIESDVWYVNHFKDIPSLMSDYEPGNSNQLEENLRVAINYSTVGYRWYIKYRTGLFYDKLFYSKNGEILKLASINQSYSYINEAEGKYAISNCNKIFLGINNTFEKAITNAYISDTSRYRVSVFGRYAISLFSGKLDLSVEARQEIVDGHAIPFIYSFGTRIPINKYLVLKSTVAKHYSLPDMNDIFWKEDAYSKGNPNLVPENGWNFEMGTFSKFTLNTIEFNHEVTFFRSSIFDLIVWLPGTDGKWEPKNYYYSKTKGIEFTGLASAKYNKSSFAINYKYSYTDALVYENEKGKDDKKESNRMYVPKHKASLSVNYGYKGFNLGYSQNYIGIRYYDFSHTLDAYSLAEISINYTMKTKSVSLCPYLKIRNLYNTSYQVMNAYAQPPRAYYLGLNVSF